MLPANHPVNAHLGAPGWVGRADLCAPAGSAADPARSAAASPRPSPGRSAEQQGRGSGQRLGVKGDCFHTLSPVCDKHKPSPDLTGKV